MGDKKLIAAIIAAVTAYIQTEEQPAPKVKEGGEDHDH
jgi:hypothetical protein